MVGSAPFPAVVKLYNLYLKNWQADVPMVCPPYHHKKCIQFNYIYIYIYRFEHDCEVKSGRRSKQRRAAGGSTLQVQTEAAAGAHLCLVSIMIWGLHCMLYYIFRVVFCFLFSFLINYLFLFFVGTKKLVFIYLFLFLLGKKNLVRLSG
jgi:hypothetical protein